LFGRVCLCRGSPSRFVRVSLVRYRHSREGGNPVSGGRMSLINRLKACAILLLLSSAASGQAMTQDSSVKAKSFRDGGRYLSGVVGYTGTSIHSLELGLGLLDVDGRREYHHGAPASVWYGSSEIEMDSDPLVAGKLGWWFSIGGLAPVSIGLAGLAYTNFEQARLYARPEFGLGIGPLKAMLGFNIPVYGPRVSYVPLGVLNIACALPLKKFKDDR
jgi:hypothetical protein